MSTSDNSQELALTPPASRQRLISTDSSPANTLLDTAKFEQMSRVANLMFATPVLPLHLRGLKKGNDYEWYSDEEVKATCFLVVNQAIRWNFDPFAVMGETYVVGGKLAWQGKLVAAVVNARAGLKTKLDYTFTGTKGKDDYTVTVSGTFEGEDKPRVAELCIKDAKTSNSMWTKDPSQKLIYSAVVRWARRYCPEVVLGVMTDDDLERITEREVGPSATPKQTAQERLQARLAQNAQQEAQDAPESTPEAKASPSVGDLPFTDAQAELIDNPEVHPLHESLDRDQEEVDEVLTDFLLSISEMTEASELVKAREQSMDFDTLDKQETAKNAILKRAQALGFEWDKKSGTFISE